MRRPTERDESGALCSKSNFAGANGHRCGRLQQCTTLKGEGSLQKKKKKRSVCNCVVWSTSDDGRCTRMEKKAAGQSWWQRRSWKGKLTSRSCRREQLSDMAELMEPREKHARSRLEKPDSKPTPSSWHSWSYENKLTLRCRGWRRRTPNRRSNWKLSARPRSSGIQSRSQRFHPSCAPAGVEKSNWKAELKVVTHRKRHNLRNHHFKKHQGVQMAADRNLLYQLFPARPAVNFLALLIVLPTNCKHINVCWVPCTGYITQAPLQETLWGLDCQLQHASKRRNGRTSSQAPSMSRFSPSDRTSGHLLALFVVTSFLCHPLHPMSHCMLHCTRPLVSPKKKKHLEDEEGPNNRLRESGEKSTTPSPR